MTSKFAIPALAVGAFGIGVTEFAPMGMLPGMARDLGVTIPTAGLLVTAYAIGVTVGAPLVTLATARYGRKALLIGLMLIFALGNMLSGIAPGFATLAGARVITALCHGTFFGAGAVVAARLVAPERQAAAVAAMFSGLTVANVAGVPAATWVGEALGWRTVFLATAAYGLAAALILLAVLPPTGTEAHIGVRREARGLMSRPVLVALSVTTIQSAAMFVPLTYIATLLRDGSSVSTLYVSAMLVLFGIGMTFGNWIGGRFADRDLGRTMVVALVSLALLLAGMTLAVGSPVIMAPVMLLWGVASFSLVPPLQLWVVHEAADAPSLSSSTNIGAFNLGNALGAAIGAIALQSGLGVQALPAVGALLALVALAIVRRTATRSQNIRSVSPLAG